MKAIARAFLTLGSTLIFYSTQERKQSELFFHSTLSSHVIILPHLFVPAWVSTPECVIHEDTVLRATWPSVPTALLVSGSCAVSTVHSESHSHGTGRACVGNSFFTGKETGMAILLQSRKAVREVWRCWGYLSPAEEKSKGHRNLLWIESF